MLLAQASFVSPKMAVPMRTCVAPSSDRDLEVVADPIDRTAPTTRLGARAPARSSSRRRCGRRGATLRGPGQGRTDHQPFRLASPRRRAPARAAARARLVEAELGLLAGRGRPGRTPGSTLPSRSAPCSTRWARSASSRESMRVEQLGGRRALFFWRWPTMCQRSPCARRSARAATWPRPPGPCSRRTRAPPRRRPRGPPPAGWVLLTATRATSSARRPARAAARAMRSRTAATRSAITYSWA